MAVYFSRRRKVEDGFIVEPVTVCINMMKSSLLIDFNYSKAAGDCVLWKTTHCGLEMCSCESSIYLFIHLLIYLLERVRVEIIEYIIFRYFFEKRMKK